MGDWKEYLAFSREELEHLAVNLRDPKHPDDRIGWTEDFSDEALAHKISDAVRLGYRIEPHQ